MLDAVIGFSLRNKLIVILFILTIVAMGVYSLTQIAIGAVPDVTNNQVQVITTSRDLATQDVEQFITYPIELEMANLPGVEEIRSISKFGLSVVTIVFEDDMGTYLPRQLIAEKIKSASENIPDNFGTPFMGPITTGLGEIYQYVLEVDPAYKERYSTMELRTIQDWIIRRQLSGIPGVVEVNTWGGFLKQYEVRLRPDRLRAMGLTASDIFGVLETNNSLAGGGYIEREDEAYFIRGEGLTKNLKDIENIVVTTRSGVPVYISDVAKVGFGHATRFGAITGNGEGEKVLGQVMMLKDANSKAVIEAVKQRVNEISSALPPGISINPFLERSELIGRTTWTITENLVLGCLIVVFVVVLLLGNLRAGLVVASVIPLALLFALTMMYIFGVDANLMSLGAIDFGIIIDGAVIIVEYTAYQLTQKAGVYNGLSPKGKSDFMNDLTFGSSSKMMHSAVFGQLIIIIVFIPVLSLSGVEGKMFQPMALTFCFALIGAMILCFTYVPVISSMFLKPQKRPIAISFRFIGMLQRIFKPTLSRALEYRKVVLASALMLLLVSGFIFYRMGGEFVPTLDEGDFVIQPVLPTGTSLSRTIEITTEIERIVKTFPEVDQVVTRIGAAEVPTDPMSMEETDVIITLKSAETWSMSKDELADAVKESLIEAIPGVDYEFTQPIEMRFNELITGVRADLAIKIFGEDLGLLSDKAAEIEQWIADVPGAADITVEKIEGLPQMMVKYDRGKIARYGLNISDVNEVISMGFAGKIAGSVFEGERRFDLVVRYDPENRQSLDDIGNAFVSTGNGDQVPLAELADITYTSGPAKISRDNTKRRIVVSVNVRNRDLESVVDEISKLVEENVILPPGYTVSYGGQFENLRSARQRLMYAVPVALFLIFIMLYFAFKSLREAFMVYTAIPLAAVGGVLLLWIRDLPFSISAGVGFIALFGVAVLNGIVLIEHFKSLREGEYDDFRKLILDGTLQRLRPVLLTASAAALGFLPMAISTSSGAEVQRPLATVVIGGLITSTLLTLVVLPVLYYMLEQKHFKIKVRPQMLILLFLSLPVFISAQEDKNQLERFIDLAITNNAGLKSTNLSVDRQASLKGTAFDIGKTGLYYSYDENNLAQNNAPIRVWGIQQQFRFPTVYASRIKLQNEQLALAEYRYEMEKLFLRKGVSQAYNRVLFLSQLEDRYQYLDSLYLRFASAANRKYELGETNQLEMLTAESKYREVQLDLNQLSQDLRISRQELGFWMQVDSIEEVSGSFEKLELMPPDTSTHAGLLYYRQVTKMASQESRVQKGDWLPDISLEYFQGTNNLPDAQVYQGFQVGIAIPLFFGEQKARANASELNLDIKRQESEQYRQQLMTAFQQGLTRLTKFEDALNTYQSTGSRLSQSLFQTATQSFTRGEIDFLDYIQTLERATKIEVDYLRNLYEYNDTVLEINYLVR